MRQDSRATPGRFITLEGIEGVGKSSHMEAVAAALRARGLDVVTTREPGGTILGEAVRELLLMPRYAGMADDTELLLMFAARSEHLRSVIEPALEAGRWIVCDRFTDATYAYQGGGRGIAARRIAVLEDWTQGELRPHLTLLLDADVRLALARTRSRASADRFEVETATFFERVRATYLERARSEPGRWRIVDATPPLETVRASLMNALETFLDQEGYP